MPKEMKWSYRTIGPFSLPQQAHGVYSVLLTVRFFSIVLDGFTTPLMSFIAEKDNQKIEADLGLFFQRERFGELNTQLIFAECKTFNCFEKKDVKRMMLLGKEFPGAVLIFATLNKSLSNNEKKLIAKIADKSRKDRFARRPFNPILILTGRELFSNFYDSELREDYGWHIEFDSSLTAKRLF